MREWRITKAPAWPVALLMVSSLLHAGGASAAVIRVPQDVRSISNALDRADSLAGGPDTIRVVGNGGASYVERFTVDREDIVIEGGWRADYQVRDPDIYVSVIRYTDNERPLVRASGPVRLELDGFTLIGGRFGIEADGADVVVRDCVFRDQRNMNTAIARQVPGGCLRAREGTLLVENCVLRNGRSEFGGAGIALVNMSSVTVIDSHIDEHFNMAPFAVPVDVSGGGIYARNVSSLHLERTGITRCVTANSGAGLFAVNSAVVAEACSVTTCTALEDAAGLCFLDCPSVEFVDCVLDSGNANSEGGGAVVRRCGSLTVTGTRFRHNSCRQEGGAMLIDNTAFTLSDCLFQGNHVLMPPAATIALRGGGVRAIASNGSVSQSCFAGELAQGLGGGWSQLGGDVTMTQTVFDGNDSRMYGGALYVDLGGSVTLRECLLRGNTAKFGGAIAAAFTGRIALENCTLPENMASISGAAVHVETGAAASALNTILCTAERSSLVHCAGAGLSLSFCNVWNDSTSNASPEFSGTCGDPTGTSGNIGVDPLFCLSAEVPPYCDPPAEVFALTPESPCAGAGSGGTDMGWRGVGCAVPGLRSLEKTTWGAIKARYRLPSSGR